MRIIPKRRAICKHNFAEYAEKEKRFAGAKRFWAKTRGKVRTQSESPRRPCDSNYNLHERAGGLPLCCFSASNVHHRSEPWAGGLQSTAKVPASPEYNVGLSGPVTHPAGTRLLRSHILLWAAEAAFMPPALPRPRRSDPSAHCRPPQALRRLQWPQGIPRRFPPRT